MTNKDTKMNRRNFLKATGTITAAGLAGCTSDSDNPENNNTPTENNTPGNSTPTSNGEEENTTENDNTEEPEGDRTSFEELYSEAERKSITGRTASQNIGPIRASEIESILEPGDSEVENVVIAATTASQHTRRREDTPYTIRHVLDELDLDAFAQKRATLGAIKTDVYVEDGNQVKKVAVTKVPHNTDIPLQYSLIGGEEPGEGDGAVADNNLAKDWNEEQISGVSYLDFRALQNAKGEDNVEMHWDGITNQVKRSYLLDMGVEGSDIDFTEDAGLYMADLEDIDNSDHTEAFEAYADTNEFYHEEVVPEDKHLLVELNGGKLQPRAVDEETLMEEGYIHSHI